tara:strand:- start:492 stop:1139 length:648 start_codon:yes stop_codon:yes gene_type:complete
MTNIHLSKMTGKLDGLHAISTNTVTNKFCQKMNASNKDNQICTICYSHNMLKSYRKNMQSALQRNSDLLAQSLRYEDLPFYIHAFMRINAHGELINDNHFINIILIARKNPHCTFALWTKRKDIVNRVFKQYSNSHRPPVNLILVYSNPTINKVMYDPPKHFHKVFNNVEYEHKTGEQNCTGQKCIDCMLCYHHNDTSVIIEAIKLNGRTIKNAT